MSWMCPSVEAPELIPRREQKKHMRRQDGYATLGVHPPRVGHCGRRGHDRVGRSRLDSAGNIGPVRSVEGVTSDEGMPANPVPCRRRRTRSATSLGPPLGVIQKRGFVAVVLRFLIRASPPQPPEGTGEQTQLPLACHAPQPGEHLPWVIAAEPLHWVQAAPFIFHRAGAVAIRRLFLAADSRLPFYHPADLEGRFHAGVQ